MKKLYFNFVLLLIFKKQNYAQNGYSMEYEMTDDIIYTKSKPLTGKVLVRDDKTQLSEMRRGDAGKKGFMRSDTVGMSLKNETSKECVSDTWENIKKSKGITSADIKIKDVKLEKQEAEKELLGFKCKKAVLKYSIDAGLYKMKVSYEMWYTDKIRLSNSNFYADPDASRYNEISEIINELGLVLQGETVQKAGLMEIKTNFNILRLERIQITEDMLIVDMKKDCTKVLTYPEYVKECRKREAQQSFNNMNMGRMR